ncbi:Uma2 family endonuclease [Romeria aff. gracilis LEGE 07310]|uniref:Uma2 family endonuclease n=1 Tax=Vasconcelosia minhoensis LEGE 07310 TaxID=915328 RepID=A0A8J7DMK4_9CYAN|nr:Uma2 family endonuclease [Romeria gracilis]MBE9078966.1 Uma2 family endonuclease [Romeria aff. gracilis LEGE 07310]
MTVQILRKKFTVEQYHRMIESGILTERDRVELLQGEIIEMSPIGRQHAACVDRLNELFVMGLAAKAIIRVQSSIRLNDSSEPQPDLAILQRRSDFYANGHPQPKDIFALVEVSDTTVEFDRSVKVPLYAQDNIAEVWIIDLNAQLIEVCRQPQSTGYQRVQTFRRGQSLAFQAFAEVQFLADRILG